MPGGSVLALWAIYVWVTHARNWEPYALTLLHTAVSFAVVLAFYRWKPFDRLYLYPPTLAHYFDVASTVVAIHYYGYREVHWLENILVNHFGGLLLLPPLDNGDTHRCLLRPQIPRAG